MKRRMERKYYVYIATNKKHTVLYTGVTNDLYRRMKEHRDRAGLFTGKYRVNRVVFCEVYQYIDKALDEEKRIKNLSRKNKLRIIQRSNPFWNNLVPNLSSRAEFNEVG